MFGLQRAAGTVATTFIGGNADSWGYYADNGNKYTNNSATSYGASYTTNDVIGVAFDADAGTLTFYKNGASQGQAYSGLTNGPYTFATGNGGSTSAVFNAGARPFAYTAPSGFKALCTTNLPAPLVTKPNTVMDVKLYTGTGATQNITGLAFSPDLVWAKVRNTTGNHSLYDIVRGATQRLASSTTSAEATFTNSLTSFDSGGFSLGSNPDGDVNASGNTYVAWTWDAGSSTVTNTQGSITSSVRANTTAGFSIVKFNTGTSSPFTVGHGLGAKPALIIDKATGAGGAWSVYHSALGATKFLRLNLTNAADTQTYPWNNTEPTSTVFTGGDLSWWGNSFDHICYCFTPVAGYSSFGSYTGNGSADGPFVYTGFRPRYFFIKRSDSTGDWRVYDAARSPYNTAGNDLLFNSSQADADIWPFDIVSNGFKARSSDTRVNASGATFIYAAFAESPFQYARAR
jgi:hypothetical protein